MTGSKSEQLFCENKITDCKKEQLFVTCENVPISKVVAALALPDKVHHNRFGQIFASSTSCIFISSFLASFQQRTVRQTFLPRVVQLSTKTDQNPPGNKDYEREKKRMMIRAPFSRK